MIKFIQKYQKYFYVVITTVIVISFSFFGTYGTMEAPRAHEQVAFVALDGTKVKRGELEQIAFFLQTDVQDKRVYSHPQMAPNFLNDGVVQKDFLENGLAYMLVSDYADMLRPDLENRKGRERAFKPYVHPKAPFISAKGVWNWVSADFVHHLEVLQQGGDPLGSKEFQSRVDLYLAERQLPAPYLAQLLWRQQMQYEWLEKDESIGFLDLSLFGYHSLDDWFGPKFSRLIAEFIYNAAIVAEEKGYRVSKEEAWANLVKNGEASFQEMSRAQMTTALSPNEYVAAQLRKMGMDSYQATKIWQKVMLFRRMFHDVANSQLVEPRTLMLPNAWASEYVEGEQYRLAKALHFSDALNLAEFELYLAATSKSPKNDLLPPQEPLEASEIAKTHPELVEKRYVVTIKQADLKGIESSISFRDTLEWETQPENFKLLKKEFADLGIQEGSTLEARVAALDSLPDMMRQRVDTFSRKQIAKGKPEWIENALNQAEGKTQTLVVRLKGGLDPLKGVKDRTGFMQRLDSAQAKEEIRLPADGFIYQIQVLDRSPKLEIATFEEASNSGVLTESLNRKLEPLFEQKKSLFEGKTFADSKRQVAEMWLEPKLKAIEESAKALLKDKVPAHMIPDIAASLRFSASADQLKQSANKTPYVKETKEGEADPEKLAHKAPWGDQFKWEKANKKISRSSSEQGKEKLFHLKPNESSILTPPNGDVSLFFLKEHKAELNPTLLATQTVQLRSRIGHEAARIRMASLLSLIKAKKAISFDDLNSKFETISPEKEVSPPDV
jgi:GcvH upstream region-like protein